MTECLEILKKNLYNLASEDEKADMDVIFSREAGIPENPCTVNVDESGYEISFDDVIQYIDIDEE